MLKKEIETAIEVGEFNGHPVLKIYEIRPDGQKKDYPTFSFGKQKAGIIVKHIEDIEAFMEGNLQ